MAITQKQLLTQGAKIYQKSIKKRALNTLKSQQTMLKMAKESMSKTEKRLAKLINKSS